MDILFILICLFFLFLGVPLYIFLFAVSSYLFSQTDQLPLISSVISFEKLQSQEFITAIPLFTFASYILSASKSPQKIFNLFEKVFSSIKGSDVGIVLIIMLLFTALTGASGSTILALGTLLFPLLLKNGRSDSFSLGVITASGSIGLLIAPSLPVIIYAIIAGQNMTGSVIPNINTLFKTGIIPSIMIVSSIMIYAFMTEKSQTYKRPKFNLKEVKGAILDAKFEIPIPILIYFGIYLGFFTVLEAAIVSSFYIFFYVFFIRRDLKLFSVFDIIIKSSKMSGSIFIIMATAFMLTNYIVDQQIPQKIFTFISPYLSSQLTFLLFLNITLLAVGFFMDIYSAILIVLPIIIPIVELYDIDPYHFAMIFLINLEIGYLTPPVGMNLFISSARFKKPITYVYKTTLPFLFIMLLNLFLITYIPPISTIFSTQPKKSIAKEIDSYNLKEPLLQSLSSNYVSLKYTSKEALLPLKSYTIRYSDSPIISNDDFDFSFDISSLSSMDDYSLSVNIEGLTPNTEYYISVQIETPEGHLLPFSDFYQFKTHP